MDKIQDAPSSAPTVSSHTQAPAPNEEKRPPSYAKVRKSDRAQYNWDEILPILQSALVAHVGFVDDGRPMVIPMAFAVVGKTIYIHGAKAARIIKSNKQQTPLCLTVTHTDGIVVARSAFHHSFNYRSAVIHGSARHVTDDAEKDMALTAITEHLLPGRWNEVRPMTQKELNSTGVIALEIEWAAAKVRQGQPVDDEEDYALSHWAGVLPVTTSIGQPLDDGRLAKGTQLPQSLAAARQKFT